MNTYKILFILTLFNITLNYSQDTCFSGRCNGSHGIARVNNNIYEGYFAESNYSKYGNLDILGKMIFKNKSVYRGEFKNGNISGFGILKYSDNSEVQGKFKNGKKDGIAIVLDKDGKPINAGYFVDDKLVNAVNTIENDKNPKNCIGNCYDGYGRIVNDGTLVSAGIYEKGILIYGFLNLNDAKYIGNIKENKPNGFGQLNYNLGAIYFGNFKNGLKEGYGTRKNSNEVIESGIWKNDILIDQKNKKTFLLEVTQKELIKVIKNILKFSTKKREKYYKNATSKKKSKFLDYFEYRYVNYKTNNNSINENITISFPEINKNNYSKKTLTPIKLINALKNCGFTYVDSKDKTIKYTFKDKKISLFRSTNGGMVLRIDYK